MLPEPEELLEPEVFAARFAEGAHLLAEQFVLGAEFLVFLIELPPGANDRDVVPEFHERRRELYKNHAQISRDSRRLA
jgi:hypothetical protein